MNWKTLGRKLLFPPVWLMAVLTIVSAVSLTAVFVRGWEKTAAACVFYVLSFYTLTVVCVYSTTVLPKRYRAIRQRVSGHPLGSRFLTDRAFRTQISLHLSLAVNMLYVGINLWFWQLSRSWWFVVLVVYYVIMASMRFLLVRYVHVNKIGMDIRKEWKHARLCACCLLLINLSLSGAVLMILYRSKGYDYPGFTIYVMALHTFYSTIHAAVDIIKYRALGSPILSAAKIVSLCAALVSMLNLETAMFSQFGGDTPPEVRRIMIILTGAGVSVIIITLSVRLISRATKEIRRMNHGTK